MHVSSAPCGAHVSKLPRRLVAAVTSGWTATCGRTFPALLDPPESPDRKRRGPGDHEEPDDDEAGLIDVEAGHELPEAAGEIELRGQQTKDLDGADQHRDRNRQASDGDVVVHLAHRLGERPSVGGVSGTDGASG